VGWLALTFEVDEAHVEAFSEALLEAGAICVSLEDAEAGGPAEQPRYAALDRCEPAAWRRNRVEGLFAEDVDCRAVAAAAARASGLGKPPAFAKSRVDEQDWVGAARAQFAPLAIGERLWVVPSWHEPPDERGVVLRLDPGLAFGTGSHPTTRLTLQWLEHTIDALAPRLRVAKSHRNGALQEQRVDGGAGEGPGLPFPAADLRVLDYGCGSGILAIAAAKLGAGVVDAVDLDPRALETTVQNALRNRVVVRAAAPDMLPAGKYDVVVANILANPLKLLEPVLAVRTRMEGRIALSGILVSQAAEMIDAYARDFDLAVEGEAQGWALLAGRRRSSSAAGRAP
jgi:ribosomal protein L11 methyltransferase